MNNKSSDDASETSKQIERYLWPYITTLRTLTMALIDGTARDILLAAHRVVAIEFDIVLATHHPDDDVAVQLAERLRLIEDDIADGLTDISTTLHPLFVAQLALLRSDERSSRWLLAELERRCVSPPAMPAASPTSLPIDAMPDVTASDAPSVGRPARRWAPYIDALRGLATEVFAGGSLYEVYTAAHAVLIAESALLRTSEVLDRAVLAQLEASIARLERYLAGMQPG